MIKDIYKIICEILNKIVKCTFVVKITSRTKNVAFMNGWFLNGLLQFIEVSGATVGGSVSCERKRYIVNYQLCNKQYPRQQKLLE